MGRIKSTMVKRAAKQLLESEHAFTEHFERNKKVLQDSMPSKPIRNKVAGYIARLIKMKQHPRQPKVVQTLPLPYKKPQRKHSEYSSH